MILETIVTTQNSDGCCHIAPMGVHVENGQFVVMPFRPSKTLDNFLETQAGVINFCDDVRIFAGCLTGRRDWPLLPTEQIQGQRLAVALAHTEVVVERVEEDAVRPKLYCNPVHTVNHAAFSGFNRAQYAVLEAAILISRLAMLPREKVESELAYLQIGLDKTAGEREREAWSWLMKAWEDFKRGEQP